MSDEDALAQVLINNARARQFDLRLECLHQDKRCNLSECENIVAKCCLKSIHSNPLMSLQRGHIALITLAHNKCALRPAYSQVFTVNTLVSQH